MPAIRLTARLRAEYARHQRRIRQIAIRAPWRDVLIVEHIPLVERIARSVRHLFSPSIPFEDLVQSGHIGLIEAASRYDPAQGEFARFAYRRIRGAIIDAHKRQAYKEELHDSLEAIQEKLTFMPARLQTDSRPLPEAECLTREIARERGRKLGRVLDIAEERIVRDALRGISLAETAKACKQKVEWAKERMASPHFSQALGKRPPFMA